MKRLRFGFIATGNISRRLAKTIQASTTCELVAAASRSEEKALAFADEFGVEAITGYDQLLARTDIDAVYIATPHPQHHEWCLKAIAARKHVLCEKPLTMTQAEAEEIAAAAQQRGVLLAEAYMYRFHPQTRKLVELVANGEIGEVCWIEADFGFADEYNPQSRLFANSLGGGGILDVGCYAVSMARLIAGAAVGRPFLDPVSVKGTGRLNDEEGTDWMAGALLTFPSDVLATVRCATRLNLGKWVRIEGSDGVLELNSPWFADDHDATIRVLKAGEVTTIDTSDPHDLYSFMLDEFAACVREGKIESAFMSPADSLGNMRVLEEWYRQLGVQYRG